MMATRPRHPGRRRKLLRPPPASPLGDRRQGATCRRPTQHSPSWLCRLLASSPENSSCLAVLLEARRSRRRRRRTEGTARRTGAKGSGFGKRAEKRRYERPPRSVGAFAAFFFLSGGQFFRDEVVLYRNSRRVAVRAVRLWRQYGYSCSGCSRVVVAELLQQRSCNRKVVAEKL